MKNKTDAELKAEMIRAAKAGKPRPAANTELGKALARFTTKAASLDEVESWITDESGFFNFGSPRIELVDQYFTPENFRQMFSGDESLPDGWTWEEIRAQVKQMLKEEDDRHIEYVKGVIDTDPEFADEVGEPTPERLLEVSRNMRLIF